MERFDPNAENTVSGETVALAAIASIVVAT
jgi:hypothetical protein